MNRAPWRSNLGCTDSRKISFFVRNLRLELTERDGMPDSSIGDTGQIVLRSGVHLLYIKPFAPLSLHAAPADPSSIRLSCAPRLYFLPRFPRATQLDRCDKRLCRSAHTTHRSVAVASSGRTSFTPPFLTSVAHVLVREWDTWTLTLGRSRATGVSRSDDWFFQGNDCGHRLCFCWAGKRWLNVALSQLYLWYATRNLI